MQNAFLATSIEFLKGVGPERAKLLKKEAGIRTYYDLLNYFPFRYIDRSQFNLVKDVNPEMAFVQLKGILTHVEEVGVGKSKRLRALFEDATGEVELVWFRGIKWVKPGLIKGEEYIVYGRPGKYRTTINIVHPEMEQLKKGQGIRSSLQPVYHSGEKLSNKGLHSKGFEKLIKTLLPQVRNQVPEILSDEIIQEVRLMKREEAFFHIHAPKSAEAAKRAQFRMKFEELFFLQLQLVMQKAIVNRKIKGFIFESVGDYFNGFYKKHLPFELTGAQKRVIKEIRKDMGNGQHMNRLLQGDVGSGKTLVALLTMLIALDNGFQACIMAPTEILANQHADTLQEFLEGTGITVGLLTGSTKTAQRRILHAELENGQLQILVGTHALLEDKVQFLNLGLVVIDEQHRFGVAQRAKLWRKNTTSPHVLVMTATPIPRTLAMTFYGDLDVSVIDELPPGRKPVKTSHRFDSARLRVFKFIEDQIALGRQIYMVYPLIEESEKMDYKDLMDGYESMVRRFPLPNYRVSIVHGRMKAADKDHEMQEFASGKTHIMVATTVIEVGVNVPNASVMIIESAEKFGLSQLHQLRGRVGRGADQSFCILMSGNKLSADAKLRLETMVRTTDGFEIAEADLKLRGPGDIMGTQQSGILDLKIADLARDGQILQWARNVALELLEKDPKLTLSSNAMVASHLKRMMQSRTNWSRIS
jgi:ATP-dependent DNA helicase RecG